MKISEIIGQNNSQELASLGSLLTWWVPLFREGI